MRKTAKPPCYNWQLRNLPGEKWKEVPGTDGIFLVSDHGRIKATERYVEPIGKSGFWLAERIVKISIQTRYNHLVKKKYYDLRAVFSYQHKRFSLGVARLVYSRFIEEIDFDRDSMMVCHKDDNDLNNHVGNLILLSCGDKQRLSYKRKRQRSHLKVLDPIDPPEDAEIEDKACNAI